MSGNTYPKKMHLHLTEHQHDKLRRYSFDCGESMQESLRGFIDGLGVASSGKMVRVIQPRPEPVSEPMNDVPEHKVKCGECKLMVTSWVNDRKGIPVCDGCAERLANSNP